MTEYPYDVAGSVEVEGLPDRGIDLLRRTFRCTNPRWRSLLSLGGDASSEPEFVEYLRETPDGRTRFPRGGLALAANALGREGMSLALRRDLRTDGEARAQTKDVPMHGGVGVHGRCHGRS